MQNPTWDKIASLARALEVPVSTIVQDADIEQEAEVALLVRDARIAAERR